MADDVQELEYETEDTTVDADVGEFSLGPESAGGVSEEPGVGTTEQLPEAELLRPEDTEGKSSPDSEVVKKFEQTEGQINNMISKIQEVKDYVSEKRETELMTEEEKLQLDVKCSELMDRMAELDLIAVDLSELVGLEPPPILEEEVAVAEVDQEVLEPPPLPMTPVPSLASPPTPPPVQELIPAPRGTATVRLEERLPQVIVTGLTEGGLPGIVFLSKPVKNLDDSPDTQSQALVERLSSELDLYYSVQEKLISDNEYLEKVRSQLVETIVEKDTEVEQLENKVHSLQKNIWVISGENTELTEQLADLRNQLGATRSLTGELPEKDVPGMSDKAQAEMAAVMNHRANQTAMLERQLDEVMTEVERIQEEQRQVQQEREHLAELHKFLKCAAPTVCSPSTCTALIKGRAAGLLPPAPVLGDGDQQLALAKLTEKCARLQHDLGAKVKEVSAQCVEVERLKDELVRARANKEENEASLTTTQDRLRRAEAQLLEDQGARGKLREAEAALGRTRQELRQTQFDMQELRSELQEQVSLCGKYRARYVASEQLTEDLWRQQDAARMDLARSSAALNDEIHRIRVECQEKLQAMSHLPDLVGVLQRKEREANTARLQAEAGQKEARRELQEVTARAEGLLRQLEETSSSSLLGQDHRSALQTRVDTLSDRCDALAHDNSILREKAQSKEAEMDQLRKAAEERDHQAEQLREQLQLVYEGCARSVSSAKDHAKRQRASMLEQMHDLERELAQARAAAAAAFKERDDIRVQLDSQVRALTDNFQQAQLRIQALQGHVSSLKVFNDDVPPAEELFACHCDHQAL